MSEWLSKVGNGSSALVIMPSFSDQVASGRSTTDIDHHSIVWHQGSTLILDHFQIDPGLEIVNVSDVLDACVISEVLFLEQK